MSFSTWIAFVVAATLIALSPGAGVVLAMSHGLAYGVRKASATVLGMQAGLMCVLFVAGAGVGSILLASAWAFALVKTAGALYLVYLGISQWRAKAGPMAGAASTLAIEAPSLRQRLLTGFLTNATNPKGILFMVAVLPQFIAHEAPLLPQLAILAATMFCIDASVMHAYALLASSMQHLLRDARSVRRLNRFFGAMLVGLGGTLFFVKRGAAAV
ncbi:MAG: LysE family transporter [Pseudomonadota bacterium]